MSRFPVRPWLWPVLIAVGAAVVWWSRSPAAVPVAAATPIGPRRAAVPVRPPSAPILPAAAMAADARTFTVAGVVRDDDWQPVAGVEVIYVDAAGGESTVVTADDGSYALDLPPGAYHAYARGDGYVSWLDGERGHASEAPSCEPGDVDTAFALPLTLFRDEPDVTLRVSEAAVIEGHVRDQRGRPVAGALVVVASDEGSVDCTVDDTDASGAYRIVAPAGFAWVDVHHPAYAGIDQDSPESFDLVAGESLLADLTVTAGCTVEGRVETAAGRPATGGVIERRDGDGDSVAYVNGERVDSYTPEVDLDGDGHFRWRAVDVVGDAVLRARVPGAPTSEPITFTCRPGARWSNVVIRLPDTAPDLSGSVVTTGGRPVRGARVAIVDADDGELRADDQGRWAVYDLEPGEWDIVASDGAGAVGRISASSGVRAVTIVLQDAASLSGRVAGVDHGWLDIDLGHSSACDDVSDWLALRRVPIVGGRYHLAGVPACDWGVSASWDGHATFEWVELEPGRTTMLDLGFERPGSADGNGGRRPQDIIF